MDWLNPGWDGRNQLVAISDCDIVAMSFVRKGAQIHILLHEAGKYSAVTLLGVKASILDSLLPYSIVCNAYFDTPEKFGSFASDTLSQLLELAYLESAAGLHVFEIEPAQGLSASFLCEAAIYKGSFTRSEGFAMLAAE